MKKKFLSGLWGSVSITAAALTACLSLPAHGAFIPVYGDPAYTSGTGGYQGFSGHPTPSSRTYLNAAGTAIGTTGKYDAANVYKGARAVRWNSSGAVELGNLGADANGFTISSAQGINATGTIVGDSRRYDSGQLVGDRAVLWDPSGTVATELANLGTNASGVSNSAALSINAAGTIAGQAEKYAAGVSKGYRAVRWTNSGATLVELDALSTDSNGVTSSVAYSINNAGTQVGFAALYVAGVSKGNRAVRWDSTGTAATQLGTLGTNASGMTTASAMAINAAGIAIGSSDRYDGSGLYKGSRAVRWDPSGTAATELPTLGLSTSGSTITAAYAINDAGTIAGYSKKYDASGISHGDRAVRWNAAGQLEELGTLGVSTSGDAFSYAEAINSGGIAVGWASKYTGGFYSGDRAVYWDVNGVAVDLNTLIDPNSGWTLQEATGISDTGWIKGLGTFDPDGAGMLSPYTRSFSLNVSAAAVPEPASAAVVAIMGLLPFVRRSRRQPARGRAGSPGL